MNQGTNQHQCFVVYDGIENSVFHSQVLEPILKELDENKKLEITLISFEDEKIKNKKLLQSLPAHDRLHIILCKKIPFIGKPSLWFAAHQFKRILKYTEFERITARGPLAGYITFCTLRILKINDQTPIIIQARGLCAEEYRYTHRNEDPHFWKTWWRHYIQQSLFNIEKEVYEPQRDGKNVFIESVSNALKDYLVETFKASTARIIIAVKDIPEVKTVKEVSDWRDLARKELKINKDAIVYCYSGSWKPWQCANQTIEYFIDIATKTPTTHLLILTSDHEKFSKELKAYKIPSDRYTIFSAPKKDLFKYLAAADFGILFREKDIINWVSRPTKALEYQAVGLKIVHNDTVGMLCNESIN